MFHVWLLAVLDVGEDAAPRRRLDECVVGAVDVGDHRTRSLLDDGRDQVQTVALPTVDADDRYVRALAACRVGDLRDIEQSGHDRVAQTGDDPGDLRDPLLDPDRRSEPAGEQVGLRPWIASISPPTLARGSVVMLQLFAQAPAGSAEHPIGPIPRPEPC